MAFTGPDPATSRRTRRLRRTALLLGVLLVAWQARAQILSPIGTALTVDDPPAPVEVMVVSLAAARAGALEVAKLHHDGIGRRIVVARWQAEPLDDQMRRLAVPWLPPHELVVAVLEKSGVPSADIQVLDATVDGLNTEIAAIAAYARASRPASLMYVTARSHGRRASWLLRRLLPAGTRLLVHPPALDAFHPDRWWESRTTSREVAMEYLRWANTFGLRDFWHREPPSVPEPVD